MTGPWYCSPLSGLSAAPIVPGAAGRVSVSPAHRYAPGYGWIPGGGLYRGRGLFADTPVRDLTRGRGYFSQVARRSCTGDVYRWCNLRFQRRYQTRQPTRREVLQPCHDATKHREEESLPSALLIPPYTKNMSRDYGNSNLFSISGLSFRISRAISSAGMCRIFLSNPMAN